MNTYKIAELKLNMKAEGKLLREQAYKYLSDKSMAVDISINLCDDFLMKRQGENPHLTIDECEYIWTGSEFYHKILDFNGFMLHASAVAMDSKAYLFSAKSGTGKSTHTRLWQEYFGEDRVFIINDDKPVLRDVNDRFYVYGTPWSGKSYKNLDIKVPLQSIIFIERAETNWINRIESKQAIKFILDQTLRPGEIEKMDKLLSLIKKLLKAVPVYKMGCNISEGAVSMAYGAVKE